MVILPPTIALALTLDGRIVRSYLPLHITRGRVVGPIRPFLTHVAQRMEYRGPYVVFVRGNHVLRIRLRRRDIAQLGQTYMALAPALRALGESVSLDRRRHTLEVRTPPVGAIVAPPPYDPREPQVRPTPVFTPVPVATARPVWHGTPEPRRTPIPLRAWATPKPSATPSRW